MGTNFSVLVIFFFGLDFTRNFMYLVFINPQRKLRDFRGWINAERVKSVNATVVGQGIDVHPYAQRVVPSKFSAVVARTCAYSCQLPMKSFGNRSAHRCSDTNRKDVDRTPKNQESSPLTQRVWGDGNRTLSGVPWWGQPNNTIDLTANSKWMKQGDGKINQKTILA